MKDQKLVITLGPRRLIAAALCIAAAAGAVFVCKWAFGHAVAVNAEDVEIAELGVQLAPADPAARSRLASLLEKTLLSEDQLRGLGELENAVALSPSNYVFWLSLGTARERAGDPIGAESALRRAVVLAPNYSRVRWALGNNLLRQGRTDEAFVELKRSASADARYAGPAVSLAWSILNEDVEQINKLVGGTPEVSAAITDLLISNGRYNDASLFWRGIPIEQKRGELLEEGKQIYSKLLGLGKFTFAQDLAMDIDLFPDGTVKNGSFTNGDFEDVRVPHEAEAFDWKFTAGDNQRVGLNETHKISGRYSLLMSFLPGGKGFLPLSQNVAVEPGVTYGLSMNYLSDISADGKLRCEIVTAGDGKMLAEAELSRSEDWVAVSMNFTVPDSTEGIILRINISGCEPNACKISGNIWLDDFRLRRR